MDNNSPDSTTKIAIFEETTIRKIFHKDEWWFVVEDMVSVLIESTDSKQYIQKLKKRDPELEKGWVQFVRTLDIETKGGIQKMNCTNTEGSFRIIQSIPSPKAEPFKRWLAKVGYERIQEIENPELATKRTRTIYKAKGYSDAWIEKRLRGIAVREELTEEWQERGIKNKEYGILTAEISKATFGMTPAQYQKYKNLKRENLRDHMTDLELIFSMLGEAATTEIARSKDAQGFKENKTVSKQGGEVAGKAREDIERRSGNKVISKKNFLELEKRKKLAN